ncbi:hypothetical protein ABPG77_007758 [Micractinium sp. CCAP 211/92]
MPMNTLHRPPDEQVKTEEGAEDAAPPVYHERVGEGAGNDAAPHPSAATAKQPDGQEVQLPAAASIEAGEDAQDPAGELAAKMEVDREAALADHEASPASPAGQSPQVAVEQRSPPKKEAQVELSEDALRAVDLVRRIAEQVPPPEPLPEAAEDGGRKARRPWMPEPIRKALSMLSPIYMQEVEQHGQAATRRVLDLLMPLLEPFATRHRVSVMLRSSQKEKKRKQPEARSGAEEPSLSPQEAASAAFRTLQASAGGMDTFAWVAAQTRWLVRHLEDCGPTPQEAQEYQNCWVLRPATRQGCWDALGRLVPFEDWEGVQQHVREAISRGAGSGAGAGEADVGQEMAAAPVAEAAQRTADKEAPGAQEKAAAPEAAELGVAEGEGPGAQQLAASVDAAQLGPSDEEAPSAQELAAAQDAADPGASDEGSPSDQEELTPQAAEEERRHQARYQALRRMGRIPARKTYHNFDLM